MAMPGGGATERASRLLPCVESFGDSRKEQESVASVISIGVANELRIRLLRNFSSRCLKGRANASTSYVVLSDNESLSFPSGTSGAYRLSDQRCTTSKSPRPRPS